MASTLVRSADGWASRGFDKRSNLPCEFPKWSNVPVKFLRSNVVKFSLRIKSRLPGYALGPMAGSIVLCPEVWGAILPHSCGGTTGTASSPS